VPGNKSGIPWKAVVNDYMARYAEGANWELEWFASLPSIDTALRHAALANDWRGKRFSHQCRLAPATLKLAYNRLRARIHDLAIAESFRQLHSQIVRFAGSIDGIGELYCYDTALRVGARLKLFPAEVFLHRGARVGAVRAGLAVSSVESISKEQLPAPLNRLPSHQVEDILCIYKDIFAGARSIRAGSYTPKGCPRRTRRSCPPMKLTKLKRTQA
jgi:hypothetical protein